MAKITITDQKKTIQLTLNFPEPHDKVHEFIDDKKNQAKVFSMLDYKSQKEIEQFYETVRELSSHIQ